MVLNSTLSSPDNSIVLAIKRSMGVQIHRLIRSLSFLELFSTEVVLDKPNLIVSFSELLEYIVEMGPDSTQPELTFDPQ